MKTVEDLKGMTHEDLVRLVQELQERLTEETKGKEYWLKQQMNTEDQYRTLKEVVKKITNLL